MHSKASNKMLPHILVGLLYDKILFVGMKVKNAKNAQDCHNSPTLLADLIAFGTTSLGDAKINKITDRIVCKI